MGLRYEEDEAARKASGFAESTYNTVFERLEQEGGDVRSILGIFLVNTDYHSQGKRVFIKDIIHYLLPPNAKPPQIAPSLMSKKRGIGTQTNGTNGHATNGRATVAPPFPYGTLAEPGNPTVIPFDLLQQFHFTFLIRDPHYSIPSYYRCTIPPLDKVTGFYNFDPSEAGYDEVRRVFDYLVSKGVVGPDFASAPPSPRSSGTNGAKAVNGSGKVHKKQDICIIDADDLLDNPKQMVEAYCQTIGLDFTTDMLRWEDEENQTIAKEAFEKWRGFHEDAIDSTELRARTHVSLLFKVYVLVCANPVVEEGKED